MRLWHYKLLHYIPDLQLKAQWRELNSIFKKQDKHILINYVYEYPKHHLFGYTRLVINEMLLRGFKIRSLDNYNSYFKDVIEKYDKRYNGDYDRFTTGFFPNNHTDRYLLQCFYNLQEKYDRGQKDFTQEVYYKLSKQISYLTNLPYNK